MTRTDRDIGQIYFYQKRMSSAVVFQFFRIETKSILMPEFFGNQSKSFLELLGLTFIETPAGDFCQLLHQLDAFIVPPWSSASLWSAGPLRWCVMKRERPSAGESTAGESSAGAARTEHSLHFRLIINRIDHGVAFLLFSYQVIRINDAALILSFAHKDNCLAVANRSQHIP